MKEIEKIKYGAWDEYVTTGREFMLDGAANVRHPQELVETLLSHIEKLEEEIEQAEWESAKIMEDRATHYKMRCEDLEAEKAELEEKYRNHIAMDEQRVSETAKRCSEIVRNLPHEVYQKDVAADAILSEFNEAKE